MKSFDLPRFIAVHRKIEAARVSLDDKNDPLGENQLSLARELLREVEAYCDDVHFHHANSKAFGIKLDLERTPESFTGTKIAAHLEGLKNDLDICMFSHRFVQIVGDRRDYLDAPKLFGKAVLNAFPEIRNDLQEAGNCIAVELNSAGVFHLMRVVEWGLRALCKNLKVARIKSGPVEYATWEDILKKLPDAVETKINRLQRGPRKQKAQEFYFSVQKDIRGFKDAWRNHIMHARASYNHEDALAVFSHVQRFMQGLASYGMKAG
jgi:hypothetical protein